MALRSRVIRQPVLQLATLRVHGHLACEQLQPAGMVDVQVRQRHEMDVVDVDPDLEERLLDRLTRTRQQRLVLHRWEVPPPQRGVSDQSGVEAGVEQHPAAVGLQQDAGHRFAHPQFGRTAVY